MSPTLALIRFVCGSIKLVVICVVLHVAEAINLKHQRPRSRSCMRLKPALKLRCSRRLRTIARMISTIADSQISATTPITKPAVNETVRNSDCIKTPLFEGIEVFADARDCEVCGVAK